MKERPILFSAPMVRAILEGRKTQTRRAVRKQFSADAEPAEVAATSPEGWQISGHSGLWWDDAGACIDDAIRCPYGKPGDRLWVRETWAYGVHAIAAERDEDGPFVYRADGTDQGRLCARWRPSIHMPRSASRILLEITAVRVERLKDITWSDAAKEGIHVPRRARDRVDPEIGCVAQFRMLWEQINGSGSWDTNPWVWVVEFKRV